MMQDVFPLIVVIIAIILGMLLAYGFYEEDEDEL